jgi:F-type H+-transporting ATPase subunit b
MLIDWFTVVAQLINFLILVWLLKRFLYKPILDAIDDRESKIAGKILNAETIQSNAKKESDELQFKIKEVDDQRAMLLTKAKNDAEIEGERLLEDAKKEISLFTEKRREEIKRQEKDINKNIIQQVQDEVFAITRKVLLDLAGTTLESQIADTFIRRLIEIDEEKNDFIQSVSSSLTGQAILRSSAELTVKQRKELEESIREFLKIKSDLQFEVVPDILGGIELIMNGQKLAWSIEDYLVSFERKVHHFFNPEKSKL